MNLAVQLLAIFGGLCIACFAFCSVKDAAHRLVLDWTKYEYASDKHFWKQAANTDKRIDEVSVNVARALDRLNALEGKKENL